MKIQVSAHEALYLRVLWLTWPFIFMLPPNFIGFKVWLSVSSVVSIMVYLVYHKYNVLSATSTIFIMYYTSIVIMAQYDVLVALLAYVSLWYIGVKYHLSLIEEFRKGKYVVCVSALMFLLAMMRVSVHGNVLSSYYEKLYILSNIGYDYAIIWLYRLIITACILLLGIKKGTPSMNCELS